MIRLYRALLAWCPPSLRDEYGAAMVEMCAARLADARRAGLARVVRVWLREVAGLAAIVWSERVGAARVRRRQHQLDMRWKAGLMEGTAIEIRQAARRLMRSPVFTLAAVSTLALAIGANVAIFTVVERVVLNPLPYPESERLIAITHRVPRVSTPGFASVPPGLLQLYEDRAQSLESLSVYQQEDMTITGAGAPERLRGALVTPSLARVLRVAPVQGRWFADGEGVPGAARVAVLSHGYWTRRFGGDRSIVGTSVMLNDQPTQLIGVMPIAVAIPDARVDVWVANQVPRAAGFGLFTHLAVARLRPGASVESAAAEMSQLVTTLGEAYPGSSLARSLAFEKMIATPLPLKESVIGNVAGALWTILGAVGLVFLVACANVANLFLVRSEARQREVSVRRALGAGSRGLVRFYLSESVLLSAVGGALGLGVAWMAVRLLVRNGPATLPRLHEVRLDASAALVAVVLSLLIAVAFAVLPFLHRTSRAPLLREGRGQTAGRQRHRMRHALMAAQVALALVLLVASGLMVRSFQNVRALDPGFNPDSTLTFRIALESRDYATRERAVAVHHAILERLQAIPGVSDASASTTLPLSGSGFGNSIIVQRRPDEGRPSYRPVVSFRAIAGGYLEAVGMRVLRGRGLTRDDIERGEPAVVVSQALADAYFPNEDPIGRQIASSRPPTLPPPTWFTIVGVVANTPSLSMIEPSPAPQLYMPMSLAGAPAIPMGELVGPNVADMSFVVRTAANPLALVTQVRAAVDAVDRDLALSDVRTLETILSQASVQMAFTMVLLAIAAVVALLLGVIGIYGVTAYIVSQRTSEIGLRLALGAEPRHVARAIVGQGGIVALAGIAIGLTAALAGTRLIASLLYQVDPRDPAIFAATATTLLLVAMAACWLPARRAARLSPVDALRID